MSIIDWIDFGKVSAERDDLLAKYFYDNGVLNKIIGSPSSFLILGRKGAGKTAVFKHLSENSSSIIGKNSILVSLSFEDYNWNIHSLLSNRDKAESLSYKQSWKFIIVVEAIKALYNSYKEKKLSVPKEIEKSNKILEKLFGSPIPTIYQIIGKKLLSFTKIKFPKFGYDFNEPLSIDLEGGEISFDEVQNNKGLQQSLSENIENLLQYLENSLSNNSNIQIYICFDRVDESWDDVSFQSSKKVIAGLVSAADSLTFQYKGKIRPIVFLREDIFEVLSINDANKLREDCGQLLHWNRDSIQKLLLSRVNYFARENSIKVFESLEDILDKKEMRQRTTQFNYITKRTMMRPRDFISYLGRIIKSMQDKVNDPFSSENIIFDVIDSSSIYDAEAGYSEWLRQEIIDEWSVQNPIIKQILTAVQNNGTTNFTKLDLEKHLENIIGDLKSQDISKHIKFLFDNSIIGIRIGDSRAWKFKCFYPTQGFIESTSYRVHEGLIRSLNLKESRESE